MGAVNFSIKSSSDPSSIYVRFSEGRVIDIVLKTGLSINPKFWDKKGQKIRNVTDVPNRDELNSKLAKLKIFIIDEYNLAHSSGEIINSTWLKAAIAKFFNRPKGEEKGRIEPHRIYYSDFAKWWLTEKAPKYKVKANKYMDARTVNHYNTLCDNFMEFEGKDKVRLDKISTDMMDEFAQFLSNVKQYSPETAKRKMVRFKFFCERAIEENIEVNKNYKARIFVEESEEVDGVYLNKEEIMAIYQYDFTKNPELEAAADNLILSCFTALRVSDLLYNLDVSHIHNGIISVKTKKTGAAVKIPLHPYVKTIIDKRFGQLPPKTTDVKYNIDIKEVCRKVGITNVVHGKLMNKKTKRIEIGYYPKFKLVSSHIGRKSFASLLKDKISDELIAKIAGWSNVRMVDHYNKKTKQEYANELMDFWLADKW